MSRVVYVGLALAAIVANARAGTILVKPAETRWRAIYVDGEEVRSTRVDAEPGTHVVAVRSMNGVVSELTIRIGAADDSIVALFEASKGPPQRSLDDVITTTTRTSNPAAEIGLGVALSVGLMSLILLAARSSSPMGSEYRVAR